MTRLLGLVLALALTGPALADTSVDARFAIDQPSVIVAHRANGFGAPENALAGIEAAIAAGIDMVELDVRVSADGVHILMHDSTFERTTNARTVFPDGPPIAPGAFAVFSHIVALYPMAEIRKLSLLSDDGTTHPVPTLEEALDLARGRILLDLDVKEYRLETLAPLIARFGAENLMVRHPGLTSLIRLHDATGASPLHTLDADKTLPRLAYLHETFGDALDAVQVSSYRITPDLLDQARALGVRLWVNGLGAPDADLENGDPSAWRAALRSGAGAFQTDLPLQLRALLKALTE